LLKRRILLTITQGITGFLVQLFLARKLYTLSRSKVLTGAILMLSLSALGMFCVIIDLFGLVLMWTC
jgi:hypothetical protein